MLAGNLYLFHNLAEHLVAADALHFFVGCEYNAMAKGGKGHIANSLRRYEVAATHSRKGLRTVEDGHRSTGGCTQEQRGAVAGLLDDAGDIAEKVVFTIHLMNLGPVGCNLLGGKHPRDFACRRLTFAVLVASEYVDFLVHGRILYRDLEQETIELRFGKAVGAFVFNGILRDDDHV